LFILGILGALAHHWFYTSLNGKDATEQRRQIEYGTALAFFTRTTLVGSVVLCYKQRIWHIFRQKAVSLDTIDALYAVTEDPTLFRNWEMIRRSKLSTLMAVASWLMPIAAVLSPGTLITQSAVLTNTTTCLAPTLNFTEEAYDNFRNPKMIDGSYGISLSYWNTTDINATAPGWFDYWDRPSKNAVRLSVMSVYSLKPVEIKRGDVRACGAGWNCTFTISFVGPGYKCDEVATDDALKAGSPFDISALVPNGNNIYMADVDTAEYPNPQLLTDSKGQPIEGPPWPADLGALKTEPKLWIGYTINTTQPLPADSPLFEKWKTVKIPKIFTCEHYETQYQVLFNYSGGHQATTVTNRTFLNPVIDTSITTSKALNGTRYPTDITPSSNFVLPHPDVATYKLTAAYHAVGHLFRSWLRGTVELEGSWPRTLSDVTETRLVNRKTIWPLADLQTQVQSVYEDLLLTLLSDTSLLIVANATVPCTRSRYENVFIYQKRTLWIGYAICIALALIFLVIGFVSMWENGIVSGTGFTHTMVTTRNPTLDIIGTGSCLGNGPFPRGLRKTKLKFGVVEDEYIDEMGEVRPGHCAFGLASQTGEIIKGRLYAGLQPPRASKEKAD
jgi:hypothetical protein